MGLLKKCFFAELKILSSVNLLTVTPLRCISMNNQECKVRPEIVNVNSDEPVFYPFIIKTRTNERTNETRHIKWHETCRCKCRLVPSVCNNKQSWNDGKFRCECIELTDKGVCHKGFIWNPSNCEWKCDKSCDIGENFDYEDCKVRNKLDDKLVEQCTENDEATKIAEITLTENIHKYSSCTLYIVLFSIIL